METGGERDDVASLRRCSRRSVAIGPDSDLQLRPAVRHARASSGLKAALLLLCCCLLAVSAGGDASVFGSNGVPRLDIEVVAQLGGATRAVAVRGAHAYIGVGPRLVVLDISRPDHPRWIGQTLPFADVVQDVVVHPSEPLVYVAAGSGGLQVIDVRVAADPQVITSHSLAGPAVALDLADPHLCVAAKEAGLWILDVSEPERPRELARYVPTPSVPVWGVHVAAGYVHAAADSAGLHILEMSRSSQLELVGVFPTAGYARTVVVDGSFGYVVAEARWSPQLGTYVGGGLTVIDCSDPTSPVEVGFQGLAGIPAQVLVRDGLAYIAAQGDGLRLVDVSDAANPTEVSSYQQVLDAADVHLFGTHVYLAGAGGGLRVLSAAEPANLVQVGSYSSVHDVQAVALHGGFAYLADGANGLVVAAVSDPVAPALAASIALPGYVVDVALDGAHAYVVTQDTSGKDGGLYSLALADPAHPSPAGSELTPVYAASVSVQRGLAVLADAQAGMYVIDVGDPSAPWMVTRYGIRGQARGVALAGDHAYLAAGRSGLQVVALANLATPHYAGACETLRDAWNVVVSGTLGYVADARWGVAVIDLSRKDAPQEVGRYDTAGNARHIALRAPYAYVADLYGVRALNVSVPALLQEVGFAPLPGQVVDIAVDAEHLYAAAGQAGLYVLRTSVSLPTPTPSSTASPTATATGFPTATSAGTGQHCVYLPVLLRVVREPQTHR